VVRAGEDCHDVRRQLQEVLQQRFDLRHTTLQVDHAAAEQPPITIESRFGSVDDEPLDSGS
jgi:cobalt-zinc-cadmium efflux system protein